ASLICCMAVAGWSQAALPPRPKLVLLIAIDQFRYDYLVRFRDAYSSGLKTLLGKGAVFVNANLEHYPTVTAVGHSTMMSGATPSMSGIMGNDWYDREAGKSVTSVSDEKETLVGGGGGEGASPRRMLVSTVGDELKRAHPESRVIGIALKDRSAILPVGHMADASYWYDPRAGDFVSSSYYTRQLPAWVREFNARKSVDKLASSERELIGAEPKRTTRLPADVGPKLYQAVFASSFGDELLENFAEELIAAERLGQRAATDLLTLSFSSNDLVGHSFGPDSSEVRDISIRTDQIIGKLLASLDKTVGLDKVLIILTSDHGIQPLPEELQKQRMPGGRIRNQDLFVPMQAALERKFGSGNWIVNTAGTSPYLNQQLIASKKLNPADVEREAAESVASLPHVARVFTRRQLQLAQVPPDRISQRVLRGFNDRRSGDLEILLHPNWIRSAAGTTHGTPYSYDVHIPLIFMGAGIKPGSYFEQVALNDLAPTVASLLEVETPNGSVGRVLSTMFESQSGRR
ncbi:MAG TPA: alkaline phosphatase family protein, partial [Bryobacteraceae bacterium]|nr:alkaline phosphatase family protein [Bryobacteraceae bacterium]